MTKDEALRLAWHALEDIGDEWGFTSQRTVPKRKEAITAIYEALAQPEQEPDIAEIEKIMLEVWQPVSPKQKPIAWYDPTNDVASTDKDSPLFTPLGQVWPLYLPSTWAGLTDEEQRELYKKHEMDGWGHFYNAIEAKLKEKNT